MKKVTKDCHLQMKSTAFYKKESNKALIFLAFVYKNNSEILILIYLNEFLSQKKPRSQSSFLRIMSWFPK